MKTLILGGVKSGKSRYAENRLRTVCLERQISDDQVAVIVTGQALDDAMAQRILKHQEQRPSQWQVIEAPLNLPEAIVSAQHQAKIIMVDCLTLWITNLLMANDPEQLTRQMDRLREAIAQCQTDIVVVSNETNMGIIPLGQLSRDYCDYVGILHQRIAEVVEEVVLVVAGLPLPLKSPTSAGRDGA